MHRFASLSIVLTLAAGAAAAAQSPYGGGGGMDRPGAGAGTPKYTPSIEPLPSPEDLAGPALPEFVVDRFELDSGEAHTYRVVFDSFMTATRPMRDTAQAVRRRIDALWQAGERRAAREQFPELRQLGEALAKEDDHFDDRLKKVFTKPHYKDYRDWRNDEKKQADQDRKDRMQQMAGGEPPPGGI